MSEASDRKSGPMDAWKPAGCMVRHRPRCRDVLPLLHLWPNEPKSVHLDILLVDRRSNISNRRLSCEKLLASGQETVPDGTTLWGYGLVKLTSYSRTSQSRSGCGSCTYTIWSLFWEGKSVLCLCRWSFWASFDQRFDRSAKATNSVRKMMQHWHCTAVQL